MTIEPRFLITVAGTLAGLGFLTGPDLVAPIRAYQECCGIKPAQGVLGPITRRSLQTEVEFKRAASARVWYHGAVGHILQAEGLVGRPYWPGLNSGVTLDPGFDLGQNDRETFRRLYQDMLTPSAITALENAIGLRGADAQAWLDANETELTKLRCHTTAGDLPILSARVIGEYWLRLVQELPLVKTLPPGPQMGVLSLYYNRGLRPFTVPLIDALRAGRWAEAASFVAAMNPHHAGLSARRKFEAALIRRGAEAL